MTENNYSSNIIWDVRNIKGPYVLITKKHIPESPMGPGGWEIGTLYEFKSKKELEEAMKVIDGIPVKTLEAKITKIHKVEVKE